MGKIALVLLFIALSAGTTRWGLAKDGGRQTPVVLELFTSQSCSSCPPADRVLQDLEKNNNVIALSCNVTYWNHLHWKDTLSNEFCTDRQRAYVAALHARGSYTPQLVVNGRHEVVGSRESAVNSAVSAELARGSVQKIGLTLSNGILDIDLPDILKPDRESSYTLVLLAHGKPHQQNILSGENRGRSVSYTNPVQDIVFLGEWNGARQVLKQDVSSLKNAHGYVLLAQENGSTGPIAAAAQIKLH